MPITLFSATRPSSTALNNFADTQVVQLSLPPASPADGVTGRYVVFGRVVIHNSDGSEQNAGARLSANGGLTTLDNADVRIGANNAADLLVISLQGSFVLLDPLDDNIIEIRCATQNGDAREASLFAISVDNIARPFHE